MDEFTNKIDFIVVINKFITFYVLSKKNVIAVVMVGRKIRPFFV